MADPGGKACSPYLATVLERILKSSARKRQLWVLQWTLVPPTPFIIGNGGTGGACTGALALGRQVGISWLTLGSPIWLRIASPPISSSWRTNSALPRRGPASIATTCKPALVRT